jgi:small GTP-binding protein
MKAFFESRWSFPMDGRSNFKIALLGDATVGKTSLLIRYTTQEFSSVSIPTVGASNAQISITHGTEQFSVSIWDTAGQERFRSLVPLYCRDADLVVLVFSIASAESFTGLGEWFDILRNKLLVTCPIVLCGSKVDLRWEVDRHSVTRWAEQHKSPFMFTSAQTGENVNELFALMAEQISIMRHPPSQRTEVRLPEVTSQSGCC